MFLFRLVWNSNFLRKSYFCLCVIKYRLYYSTLYLLVYRIDVLLCNFSSKIQNAREIPLKELKFGRVRCGIHISSTVIFFLHFSEKERFSIKKDDFAYLGRRNAKHSKQERNGQPSFTDDSCGVTFGRHDGSFHFSSHPLDRPPLHPRR